MHSRWSVAMGLVLFLAVVSSQVSAQETDTDFTGVIQKLKVYAPEDHQDAAYLGLQGMKGKVPLSQIKAEVLIVEIFSMYCPFCQKHAPDANKLYQAIDSRREFRDKIKMIGIGVGNSPFEVGIFKKKYSPPFPLFDDRDAAVANSFSGLRTPHYLGIRSKNANLEIFYSESGGFSDPEEFLKMMVKESGIQRGGSR